MKNLANGTIYPPRYMSGCAPVLVLDSPCSSIERTRDASAEGCVSVSTQRGTYDPLHGFYAIFTFALPLVSQLNAKDRAVFLPGKTGIEAIPVNVSCDLSAAGFDRNSVPQSGGSECSQEESVHGCS